MLFPPLKIWQPQPGLYRSKKTLFSERVASGTSGSRAGSAPKRSPLRQRPGCAGPRDICRLRSRLTPCAPPQLPGRCHPPRSGCRLSPPAQTLGPRLRAPRQLPRMSALGGVEARPERGASWAVASWCLWLSHLRPSPPHPRPAYGGLSLILSTPMLCSSPLYSRI